jgi:hypothetical protein
MKPPHLLRNCLQDKLGDLDILCIQEHKLRGTKLSAFGSQIWKNAMYLAQEASPVMVVQPLTPMRRFCPKLPKTAKICPKTINLRNFEIPPKIEILVFFKK